jgi:hypothetical protein
MRLAVLLCLAVPSAAAAQGPLFPDGAGPFRTAAPHWRAAVGGGFVVDGSTRAVALGVERTVSGPVALGARASVYAGGGFLDDGPTTEGGAVEALTSVGTRDRVLDLRAFAGVGVAAVAFGSSGPGEFRAASASGVYVRPLAVAGVGLDVYPLAGVGVGVEARGAVSTGGGTISDVTVGLRVRLAR